LILSFFELVLKYRQMTKAWLGKQRERLSGFKYAFLTVGPSPPSTVERRVPYSPPGELQVCSLLWLPWLGMAAGISYSTEDCEKQRRLGQKSSMPLAGYGVLMRGEYRLNPSVQFTLRTARSLIDSQHVDLTTIHSSQWSSCLAL